MEGEEEEEGDDTGDGDEFAQASSTRFSELTKSMIRASSASQLTGVESIVVLFPSIPFVFVSSTSIFLLTAGEQIGNLRVAASACGDRWVNFVFYQREETTTEEANSSP